MHRITLTARLSELDFPTMPTLPVRREDLANGEAFDAWQERLARCGFRLSHYSPEVEVRVACVIMSCFCSKVLVGCVVHLSQVLAATRI